MEPIQASENLQKFFTRLLALKKFVLDKCEETNDPTLIEIYNQLDAIMKEKQ